ncbi:MAG: glycosyltransferase family 39 protein [Anaerolineales bacterium]|uniref:ArnT family glycosyltransferase n=1 Tax=Candidatus Villigracilis vicinus TaxID=3140679 RepID=UPI003134708B|nr:glycosyltransferase family 39 protein [Anaerolineales bacterium]
MNRNKLIDVAIYIGLIVVFLVPRLAGIGSFVTLDEPSWLSQGANFYYALGQREFENTVYEYQPAVTTMSIISLGMLLYFPEYRGFGQGYLDYEKGRLDPFMIQHGKDPLMLLIYSRVIQVFVLLVLCLTLYFLLQKFLPKPVAVFALVFAMFDPFYLSQHRLMDHEGMVSLFVLISLISFALYLFKEHKFAFLILSGVAGGFAQLSKSSAVAMLAAMGVMLLWRMIQDREQGWVKVFIDGLRSFGIWFAILLVTYFVFWPGMWVAPGKMLYTVYGNAFSYAFQGARLKVTEELDVAQFSLNTRLGDIWEVFKILLYRTTPWTWLGVLLGFALPFTRDSEHAPRNKLFFTLLLTNGIAFVLLIGIAQGRNSPHYILSSYLSFNLLAGLGWFHAAEWLVKRIPSIRQTGQVVLLSVVMLAQTGSALMNYPYYFTYRNPILAAAGWYREFPHFPYCEGLELAAQYLAELPDAKNTTVFAYYSRGCVSYYYPGPTISYRPYYSDGDHTEDLLNNLRASEYLVVYYANQGQLAHHLNFVNAMAKAEPFHVIWLNGYEYVRIYKVDDLQPEIFEALAHLK